MRLVWMFLGVAMVPPVMAGEPGPQLKLLGTLEGARPRVYAPIAFSPDGKTLASCEEKESGSVVKLWDVDKRKVRATLQHTFGVSSVAFSPDGKTLATGGGGYDAKTDTQRGEVTLWDVATGKEKVILKGHPGGVGSVAFSPDGKTVAGVTGPPDRDHGEVRLWDVATGKEKAILKGHAGPIFSIAFSPDGKTLATGSGQFASNGQAGAGEVKLWEVVTGRERAAFGQRVKLRFTARSLAYMRKAGGVPKTVLLKLAALNGTEFPTEEEYEKELPKLIDKALGKDNREKYRDLVMQQAGGESEGLFVVWSVAFSPDSKTLASADVYGNVLLWDLKSGRRAATLQAFHPNGKEEDINGAYSVAFSPDGNTLAAGTVRGIKLWDVQSGKSVGTIKGPSGSVWSVAFSPDGKTVSSAGSKRVIGMRDRVEDGPTLRLWELIPPKKADK